MTDVALQVIGRLAEAFPSIEVYTFGSWHRAPVGAPASDVDVLLVYRDLIELRRFKSILLKEAFFPVDLIAMTPAECDFYDFIDATGAIKRKESGCLQEGASSERPGR
ncbi:nucleotidyltransferase domain-containing protein [Aeromicrobium sp. NPDC092404]|uniref:nucleotidyltransferase domain-containing protein n=1 Tax=Aeromicrobium sp. NPDC092404 TaxID=3154976 RepID=UPI003432D7E1